MFLRPFASHASSSDMAVSICLGKAQKTDTKLAFFLISCHYLAPKFKEPAARDKGCVLFFKVN